VADGDLPALLSDLGGHDLHELLTCFRAADEEASRPTVLFAYTMKGWHLPMAGDPLNHAALLSTEQIDTLRTLLNVCPEDDWASFPAESAEAKLCACAARRLYPAATRVQAAPPSLSPADIPLALPSRIARSTSSQETFGNAL